MNCLAIWYKHKPLKPKKKLDVELHINLWQLKRRDNREKTPTKNFLDIGIKILEPISIDSIKIYLPFKVAKGEIEDIAHFFEGHDNLVAAIFNDEFKAQPTQAHSKTLEIVDGENNVQFYIYMIDKKNDITLQKNIYGGSIIEIKRKSAAKYKPLYYRIRINSDNLKVFYSPYKPESRWLDYRSTTTDLIDFRVNEKRNLDRTLLEDMRNSGEVFFKRVEYFVMREFKYDYVSSHKEMLRSRRLEEDLWNIYVGDDCDSGKLIAYHWSWKDEPGFNAFVKYRFLSSDVKTKVRFCLFLLGIGFIGGTLGTLLIKLISLWWS